MGSSRSACIQFGVCRRFRWTQTSNKQTSKVATNNLVRISFNRLELEIPLELRLTNEPSMQRSNSLSIILVQEAAEYFELSPSIVHALSRPDLAYRSESRGGLRCDCVVSKDLKSTGYGAERPRGQTIEGGQRVDEQASKHKKMHTPASSHSRHHSRQTLQRDQDDKSRRQDQGSVTIPLTPHYVDSTATASTNSLPSISSSPSVSPSLVCPHLSLDDILSLRDGSESPHTIGLCPRCRLSPPSNIHSPLSPIFKPSISEPSTDGAQNIEHSSTVNSRRQTVKLVDGPNRSRSYIGDNNHARPRIANATTGCKPVVASGRPNGLRVSVSDLGSTRGRLRDDSLDYSVDVNDVRRMQLSPTLRHSVEFIRTHSSESGRIVKVYKNGLAYDKPLRVCINRGEFKSLNHFLDHINGRQLVPFGARYLFHLDGQLVYSVNELKHGSAYIVSGTRQFGHRSAQLIKDREQAYHLSSARHRTQVQQLRNESTIERVSSYQPTQQLSLPPLEAAINTSIHSSPTTSNTNINTSQSPSTNKIKLPPIEPNPIQVEENSMANKPKQNPTECSSYESKATKDAAINVNPMNLKYTRKIAIIPNFAGTSTNQANKSRESFKIQRSRTDSSDSFDQKNRPEIERKMPTSLVRAKSDFTSVSKMRPKKNVTFSDTGRGSSPAIVGQTSSESSKNTIVSHDTPGVTSDLKAVGTNDIGIQVSDSIDGFLIDLPLPLPSNGNETPARSYLRKGQGAKQAGLAKTRNGSTKGQGTKRRQIVTITERQLSSDELNQFRDLDRGDHHKKIPNSSQKILLPVKEPKHERRPSDYGLYDESIIPCPSDSGEVGDKATQIDPEMIKSDVANEFNEYQAIENETKTKTDSDMDSEKKEETKTEDWQYPGGQAGSATPTERPVSQNAPNETVHARVTTPTPSLSTAGDNTSLSMSYETPNNWFLRDELSSSNTKQTLPTSDLADKHRIPVMGKLCKGFNAPGHNFKLVWLNGLLINDRYSDDASGIQDTGGLPNQLDTAPKPDNSGSTRNNPSLVAKFKPNDRFSNWVCYSQLHDELIYPVGRIVVLWCRWNSEQRYYSSHSSNVSSICLGPSGTDLVVSAQIGEPKEKIMPLIHVWSGAKLETLVVVKDDQFIGRKIFAMHLSQASTGNEPDSNLEMVVCAREEKRLWIFSCVLGLEKFGDVKENEAKKSSLSQKISILKVNRPIQASQTPLIVAKMSSNKRPTDEANKSVAANRVQAIVTAGCRHFYVSLSDPKQGILKAITGDDKNLQYSEAISKANCWICWSPDEFLTGDSDGNISLMSMSWPDNIDSNTASTSNSTKNPSTSSSAKITNQQYKFKINELIPLCNVNSVATKGDNQNTLAIAHSITCISKISPSLFVSGDTSSAIRFWRFQRGSDTMNRSTNDRQQNPTCIQLSSITLPTDIGYVCNIIASKYSRHQSMVEFYIVSTSNSILFGSIHLEPDQPTGAILAKASLSVVFEGHETPIVSLVPDYPLGNQGRKNRPVNDDLQSNNFYFTCSLDHKICKWNGKSLLWKSVLPSACASLAVHPVGFVLAVGSGDGTVYIVDKISGLLISYFPLTPVCINCLAYSRDGALLAAGCANGSIFILPVSEKGLKYKKVSLFQVSMSLFKMIS